MKAKVSHSVPASCAFALVAMAIAFVACQSDVDAGSVRVSQHQVIGTYITNFENGSERLELKPDGTYTQEFISKTRPFRHAGKWQLEHEFLSGSAIVLTNAVVSEQDEAHPLRFGALNLYTHEREGKLALARNAVADWYYERVP